MNRLPRGLVLEPAESTPPLEATKQSQARQPGQALIMVGLMMMTLIGFAALATDTGFIWMNRRSLQNAVDAAALAGVQALPEDTNSATTWACDYATNKNAVASMFGKNGTCSSKADVAFSQSPKSTYTDTITVTSYKVIHPIFGAAVGFGDITISATATAVVGSIASACPFPFFQTTDMLPGGTPDNMQFYTLTAMHLSGFGSQKGNALTVDVGSGANAVYNAMVSNSCGTPLGLTASTETGEMSGKVIDGFNWRLACAANQSPPKNTPSCPPGPSTCPNADISSYLVQDPSGQYQLSPSITRANCLRLVMIPIFPGPFTAYSGKEKNVTIKGFAIYYLSGVCSDASCTHPTLGAMKKGDAWGYYVRMAGQADQYITYNGYGTKVFALVN